MALQTTETQYNLYTVQKGDTLYKIAKNNDVTITDIINYNNLRNPNDIKVGTVLKVSIKQKETPEVPSTPTTTDDKVEEEAKNAASQNTNATLEEKTLTAMKETYQQTGSLGSISNEINYLYNNGYTSEEISTILNQNNPEKPTRPEDIDNFLINSNSSGTSTSTDGTDVYENDFNVLGMPFRFNKFADPRRRIYTKTFVADGPIVSIIPGVPEFRKNDPEIKDAMANYKDATDGKTAAEGEQKFITNKKFFGDKEYTPENIKTWLLQSQKNNTLGINKDLRYYHLKPDYAQFLQYFDLVMNVVGTKMRASSFIDLASDNLTGYKDLLQKILGTGKNDSSFTRSLRFYCTKNITVSESISNEFGQSTAASAAKSISDMAKEFMFLTGTELVGSSDGKIKDAANVDSNIISSALGSLGDFFNIGPTSGSLGEIFSGIHQSTRGVNLVYPDIWKDSTFSKDISVNFEFSSPYGSPEAIWKYVYTPFLVLLTLAAPHQVGSNGYTSPFICKIDMPGYLSSDLAAIVGMNWTKGGQENLYNKDGLPLAMSVSISIKDLSPALTICKDWALLRHNTGLHSFLDNMAGLSLERFTPLKDIADDIKGRTAYILGGVNRTAEDLRNKAFYIIKSGADFFR